MLHVDIMDGHFVPNFTMGTPITEALRRFTKLKLDHHLMIEDPDTYAPIFIKAGADCVSVHYEVCRNLDRTLHMIQDHGAKAGVVINPHTPVLLLEDVLHLVGLRSGDERQSRLWRPEFHSRIAEQGSRTARRRQGAGSAASPSKSTAESGPTTLPRSRRRAWIGWWPDPPCFIRADPAEAVRNMLHLAEEAISVKV